VIAALDRSGQPVSTVAAEQVEQVAAPPGTGDGTVARTRKARIAAGIGQVVPGEISKEEPAPRQEHEEGRETNQQARSGRHGSSALVQDCAEGDSEHIRGARPPKAED
jgi:hypothetical protein